MNDTGGGDHATRQAPPSRDDPAPAAPGGAAGPRLSDAINAVLNSARQALADFVELVSLELHRAGVTFMWMMAWSTFAVLLIATAWIGLMAGLALWLISLDVSPVLAVMGIALANLIGGAVIFFWCVNLSRELLLPATRRQLRITPADARAS